MDYGKLEQYLKKVNAVPGSNYVIKDQNNEFAGVSKIKIGQKFYVSCRDNVTSETVEGYAVYDFYDISQEFYPMLLNNTNLCKYAEGDYSDYNKNIVIVSSDPIVNKINYTPTANEDLMKVFKKRILEDVKNFQVYADGMNTQTKYITEVLDKQIVFFKGDFIYYTGRGKIQEQYFVSYLLQNSDSFINANYVMNSKGEVIEFFTAAQSEFEYRKIAGICDYDNDGIDEIIIDVGYYEGGGYELWKFNGEKFYKVTDGFYFGL